MMLWTPFMCLSVLAISYAINRPVLKIVLNQKGYAQFIQYDVETPPLREFTLCVWIRVYDLAGDQSIFTYVGSGSTRIIRLWLDSGGQQMKVSINEQVTSSVAVDFAADVWRHVCLSYQSDYGAWALYVDSQLVFCESSDHLLGFVVPAGGSLILGYGTSEKGSPNGLEGEIFGASMILFSTIERNFTLKRDPRYEQKQFRRNRIKGENEQDNKYIVLGDLQVDEIRESLHGTTTPIPFNKSQNYIHFTTPHSFIEHDVGIEVSSGKPKHISTSSEKEIFDNPVTENLRSSEKDAVSFWNLVTKHDRFKVQSKKQLAESGTVDLPTVFEYETPPSPIAPKGDYSFKTSEKQESTVMGKNSNKMSNKQYVDILSDVEKPPRPQEKSKVYGQWTSSKFVGNVLKYLKSINFNQNREQKKVPSTIPLVKLNDVYPYQSEFKYAKLRPPLRFNRRSFVEKRRVLKKRDTNQAQINVKVIENDVREDILKSHSETRPKHVEVTNRGEANYKNAEIDSLEAGEPSDISRDFIKEQPFSAASSISNQKKLPNLERHRGSNLMTILPFLKSVEYFIDDNQNNQTKRTNNNEMYSKSFANANKWHNVKSYSNDYTPRRIDLESDGKSNIDAKIAEVNRKHPSVRMKYKHGDRKLVQVSEDDNIVKGRALAEKMTNLANGNKDSISLLKFNHGFLPGHEKKMRVSDKISASSKAISKHHKTSSKSDFNKHVKLGNALNERHIIGRGKEQSKQSFVGGDDKIPDINKYRSDLDNEYDNVPSSLGPRVCKGIGFNDRVLYIQQDGSIDLTHILSPVRQKNNGVEFILQNYRRCSMLDSPFEKSPNLLIDWNKTPVKLFGGAYPRKTRDLCGFF